MMKDHKELMLGLINQEKVESSSLIKMKNKLNELSAENKSLFKENENLKNIIYKIKTYD